METNPYASSTSEIQDDFDACHHALTNMSPKEIKKLYMHSRTINVVAFLWALLGLLALASFAYLMFNEPTFENEGELLFYVLIGGLLVLHVGVAFTMRNRPAWGRSAAMIWTFLTLWSFNPLAIIIGVLLLYGLWNGKPLFGVNRLKHQELKNAWRAFKRGQHKGKRSFN